MTVFDSGSGQVSSFKGATSTFLIVVELGLKIDRTDYFKLLNWFLNENCVSCFYDCIFEFN